MQRRVVTLYGLGTTNFPGELGEETDTLIQVTLDKPFNGKTTIEVSADRAFILGQVAFVRCVSPKDLLSAPCANILFHNHNSSPHLPGETLLKLDLVTRTFDITPKPNELSRFFVIQPWVTREPNCRADILTFETQEAAQADWDEWHSKILGTIRGVIATRILLDMKTSKILHFALIGDISSDPIMWKS